MKIDQNFIKNQLKRDMKLKVIFRSISFLIFVRFQLGFGSILAPKWAGFCCRKRRRKHYQAQTGLQRPSGPHLGPFWKRFGTVFGALKALKNQRKLSEVNSSLADYQKMPNSLKSWVHPLRFRAPDHLKSYYRGQTYCGVPENTLLMLSRPETTEH